jgi:hypothetical protein
LHTIVLIRCCREPKMTLSEIHKNFENDCRRIIVGQTIEGIIYGELRYSDDEHFQSPITSYYKTKFEEIHTIDNSIYFVTDGKAIHITWDNTFECWGLKAESIDFNDTTNSFQQKWDVTMEPMWRDVINNQIIDFKIYWEDFIGENVILPQAFELTLSNNQQVWISAAQFSDVKDKTAFGISDNLLVTLDKNSARNTLLIRD